MFESNLPDNVILADFYEEDEPEEQEESYTCRECYYFCRVPLQISNTHDACLFSPMEEGRADIEWIYADYEPCQLFELK